MVSSKFFCIITIVKIDAEAIVVIGTLMPHLRGVVRGEGW